MMCYNSKMRNLLMSYFFTPPLGPKVAINMCFIQKYIDVNLGQYHTFYIH